MEATLVPRAGLNFKSIVSLPLARKLSLSALKTLSGFHKGYQDARRIISDFKPDVAVGFGGYVTGPLMLAAARSGVRTIIHEQNAMPGRANRLLSHWVSQIALNFDEAKGYFPKEKTVVVGLPVRESFKSMKVDEARKSLGLKIGKKTLLIYGGSLGAQSLNKAILGAASQLQIEGIQILHQTGTRNYEELKKESDRLHLPDYHVVPYIDNVAAAFAASDLGVCRSGASTIAEITASGLPVILVPYPFAISDHQTFNARVLSDRNAAILVPDKELTSVKLFSEVMSLISDEKRLEQMHTLSHSQARLDAAQKMAELILSK